MSEAWVWQYIPGETFSGLKKNVTQLQLDIFSAFYVLFYLWLLKALSRRFCNLCAHKLNGCHWNYITEHLKPILDDGSTVEKVSKGIWGFNFVKYVPL